MMKQMRDNTKWIMLITAAAFVALMVFEWGMDATGRSGMSIGDVGSVNGTGITYEQWMSNYRVLYDQAQTEQEEPITSQQNEELEDQAWDETVNQVLIRQELAERDIQVTDAEIQRAARFNPPPSLMQNPAFQNEQGQFDPQLYQNFLATSADNATLLQLEQYYRSVIPESKLMRQITSGIYPTDGELWQRYEDRNEQARVRLAALNPAERVDDSEVSVDQAEIEAYYEENREDFRVPAQASMRIAVLAKAPTAADTAAARERAAEIRQDILDGVAEFGEMARLESSDRASAERDGDLGTFGRGQMVPEFEEAAFSAEEGEITEPVQSQFGFHVIQVRESTADSVTASHILVPIERTDDSELEMLIRADSLEAMGEDMTLDEAAGRLGLQVRTVRVSEDFPVAPGAGTIRQGFDWAFEDETEIGDVSPVFENDQAFYAVELTDVEPEGYRSLGDAEDEIRRRLMNERKQQLVVEGAGEIVERARSAGSLVTAAEEAGLEVQEPGPFTRTAPVPGVGRVPEVSGAAFGLDEGQIAEPIATEIGDVYLLEVLERIPADSTAWLAQVEQQRTRLVQQIQQQRLQEWLAGLRESATIRDRRDEVLRAAEEAQEQQENAPFTGMPF